MSLRAALAVVAAVAGLPVMTTAPSAVAEPPDLAWQLRTVAGGPGYGQATALARQLGSLAYRDGVLYSGRGGVVRALDLGTGEQRLVAGHVSPTHYGDGPAASMDLRAVVSVAAAADGRVVVADQAADRVVFLERDGAARVPRFHADPAPGGLPAFDQFREPGAVAAAPDGTVYAVRDSHSGDVVYALTPDGRQLRVVGGAASSTGCAVGPGTAVAVSDVHGLAIDQQGRLLVSARDCVRRLEPSGVLVRVAGGGDLPPDPFHYDQQRGDGGPALDARVEARAIATDGADLYIADRYRVRRVRDGVITTVAGTGHAPDYPTEHDQVTAAEAGDGQAATAVRVDAGTLAAGDGTLWFADGATRRVRAVRDGVIGTVAGNGDGYSGGDGGAAPAAQFSSPADIALLPGGGYVVTDQQAGRVRRVAADGTVSTLAGDGRMQDSGDGGPATAASLHNPRAVAAGPDGSVYVATNFRFVRRISPDGVITRFAGNGTFDPPQDGVPAAESSLWVEGMDVGLDGSLYIATYSTHSVRRVSPDGLITTVAGGNGAGFSGDGGPATAAQLSSPADVDVQPDGGFYIADRVNNRIRYVSPGGLITTVAGGGTADPYGTGTGDGGPALQAHVPMPGTVAATAEGILYLGQGQRIREVRAGVIRTVAGATGDTWGAPPPDVTAATRQPLRGVGGLATAGDGVLFGEPGAARVRLLLADVRPSAPAPITVTPASRRLLVRWTEPAGYGGSPPDSYTVSATPSDGGAAVARTVPAAERETRLIGLRNGVQHVVRVFATNNAGAGEAATTTATPRAGLPGAPRYPAARITGPGTAEVTWTRPEDGGAGVEAYRVTTLPGGAVEEAGNDTTRLAVDGLAAGTAYRFTVAARTAMGWGEDSPPTAPVSYAAAPAATVSRLATVDAGAVVAFAGWVRGVRAANVVLRDTATGAVVATDLLCRTPSAAAVCAEDAVTSVTVRPRTPLMPGTAYTLTVNPDGAPPVTDLHGQPVAGVAEGLRYTSEQEATAAGRRLWRRVNDSRAEGGQYAVERRGGARVTAVVTGTRVTWTTTTGPGMGRAELWVDGVKKAAYDNAASVRTWQVRRTVGGLPDKAHTVEVRVVGGGDVVVDSLGSAPRYEWRRLPSRSASGGAYAVADLRGAEASFTFRGTAVAWYAVRGPAFGQVAVYVDGQRRSDIDYYAATTAYGVRHAVSGLAPGVHTVRLMVLGTRSARATGTSVGLDRWEVLS